MKQLSLFVAMMIVMALFTGCAATDSSSDTAFTPPDEEIAAVEASLLVDRTLAASIISQEEALNLRAATGVYGSKRYRNRNYQVEGAGNGMALRRGDGSCSAIVTADGITMGTEQCTVERLASGALKITRGNGTIIETPAFSADSAAESIIVDGVEWQISFGSTEGAPLATLKNSRSGMILTINEQEDGSLTIVRDNSEVYQGRWAADGDLEFSDGKGQKKRYRYGRNR